MKLRDIMSTNIVSLNPNDTVEDAAQIMKEHNIGSVPICEGEKVIGIVTDRDIVLRSVASGENFKHQSVRNIMSSNPVLGNPEMKVQDVERVMGERQIRRIPVVENNKLTGMVSLGDIAVQPKLKEEVGDTLSSVSEPSTPEF